VPLTSQPDKICAEVVRLLRQQRTARGWSVYRVAKEARLSQQMIHYIEAGQRNPTLSTLLRLADALDVDLWKLIKAGTGRASSKKVTSGRA
jgi:transcriptional regulator with XRE-family HTH domain